MPHVSSRLRRAGDPSKLPSRLRASRAGVSYMWESREKSFAQECIIHAGVSDDRGVLGVNWAVLAKDFYSWPGL
jgi:hypothetical protein